MSVFLTWEYWQLVLLYMAWGLSKAVAMLLVGWVVQRDVRLIRQQWHALRQPRPHRREE